MQTPAGPASFQLAVRYTVKWRVEFNQMEIMHGLNPSDLFVFHDWLVEAMKKIEDHANTRGWAIIRHQTTCVLSCVGPAESDSTALLDQDD